MNNTTAQQNIHNQIHSGGTTTTGCFPRRKDGFGSHGSIDVLSAQNASFISTSGVGGGGQYHAVRSGSVGTATARPFLSLMNPTGGSGGGGADGLIHTSNHHNSKGDQVDGLSCVSGSGEESTKSLPVNSKVSSSVVSTSRETASPRLRLKFLSSSKDKNSSNGSSDKGMGNLVPSGATAAGSSTTTTTTSSSSTKSEASIFRKFRSVSSTSRQQASKSLPEASKYDTSIQQISGEAGDGLATKVVLRHPGSNPMEERYRRRALAHHDCQSISANISYAARLRGLLSKRRNTTTGASAASLGQRSPPDTSTNGGGGSGSVSGSSSTINGGGVSPSSSGGPPLSLVQPSSHNNNASGSSTSGSSNNLLQVPGQQDTDLGDGKSNALVLR